MALLILHAVFQDYKDLENSLVWGNQEVAPVKRIQGQVNYQEV